MPANFASIELRIKIEGYEETIAMDHADAIAWLSTGK